MPPLLNASSTAQLSHELGQEFGQEFGHPLAKELSQPASLSLSQALVPQTETPEVQDPLSGSSAHELLTLQFRIDVAYLVMHTLTRCGENYFVRSVPRQHIVEFQNEAWSIDAQAYRFLQHGIEPRALIDGRSPAQLAARAEHLLEKMASARSFARIFEETKESLNHVEAEWQSDLQLSHQIMFEMTGIVFRGRFEVFLTHPAQRNGRNLGGPIAWSYRSLFPHYNTVYLWHEILHNFLDGGDVVHSVIELLADNELRVRLGGKAYPPLKGHKELRELKESLMPAWQRYLESHKKDIFQFIDEAKQISPRH